MLLLRIEELAMLALLCVMGVFCLRTSKGELPSFLRVGPCPNASKLRGASTDSKVLLHTISDAILAYNSLLWQNFSQKLSIEFEKLHFSGSTTFASSYITSIRR